MTEMGSGRKARNDRKKQWIASVALLPHNDRGYMTRKRGVFTKVGVFQKVDSRD